MPLEESYSAEQFQSVPENQRDWYRQDGDKYVLDVVPRKINSGTLEAKRKAEQEAENLRKKYGDLDPDAAKKAIEAQKAAEQKKLQEAGEFDKLLGQTKAEKDAEIAKLKAEYDAKIAALDGTLATKLRDEELLRAAIASGVKSEFHDDVLLHGKEAFEVKDGKLVAKGHTHETVEKWLKDKLSKKKGWLGESTGGGTAKGNGGSGVALSGKPRSQMTDSEKIAFIKLHGKDKFLALPDK
jgi:hypothetical protein